MGVIEMSWWGTIGKCSRPDERMGVIEMGWWGTIESAHGLMEGVEGWESLRWAGGEQLKVLTA